MNWQYSPGWAEYVIFSCIAVFYLIYIIKLGRKRKTLVLSRSSFWRKLLLRFAYLFLLFLVLLGPSFGESRQEVATVGKEIMIVLDLSKSMDAIDVPPSRLGKTKNEMLKLVDAFSGDKLGLTIFSYEAYLQCPLTYDLGAMRLFLENVHTGLVPGGGTDFARALELAADKLDRQEDSQDANSRIILLVSDGEDWSEETASVVNDITKKGIRIVTLGVGTERGGTIGRGSEAKRDREGNLVITKLDSEGLRKIAKMGDGKYFEINKEINETQKLINYIDSIEGSFQETIEMDVSANKYAYFLYFAIALILIDLFFKVNTLKV
ncbi:MAG: VWA domain-containing protein [Cyclobacteriaceae bacterium]|nr:VWA domain-containing protein [Cyclobacteriaceae bacterium]MCH8516430.1 VWA domain-containing protein [Cyclobacteriaceae bacterium]